jgi:hypothetical protein
MQEQKIRQMEEMIAKVGSGANAEAAAARVVKPM